jgi:hypothetical protein
MLQLCSLKAIDQQTICRALKLPLPTPDITLDMIIAQEKIHPDTILTRLEQCTDIRALIAAAALRGTVKLCPDDAQLHPKPYPKAPVKTPKAEAEAARQVSPAVATRRTRGTTGNRRLAGFVPNPKREGSDSRDRYALYVIGLTEGQLLDRGLWRADFRHDTAKGYITWTD